MKALIPLYLASVKEYLRDRMAIFWTLAFPIFFMLIFGLLFSSGGDPEYDVALVVEDDGPAATAITEAFQNVPIFAIEEGERDAQLEAVRNGDLDVVILVPEGTSAAVAQGQTAPIEVYYDPSSQTTSQVVLTIVQQVVDGIDRGLTNAPRLLTVESKTITSDQLTGIDFLLPGILGMALMQLGLFGTAPQLVQMREQQVLRRLGATPLPRTTLLASQILFRLTLGALQAAAILLVGRLAFGAEIGNRPLILIGLVLLGAVTFIAVGYLIAALAKTQESVQGISSLVQFPMMFLSGLFFPVEFVPSWLQPVVRLIPLTYLADALRQIMIGSPPLYSLSVDLLVLVGWLTVSALLAVRLFRWE